MAAEATMPAHLIYLHVPKCGGSTLNRLLEANYPDGRRFYVNPHDVAASRRKLAAMPEAQARHLDLVYGHLSFGWHEHLPRSARYLTLVRDPVARVVSHYNYVRYRSDHSHYLRATVEAEDMSIADYVTSGVCDELNNGQTRLLAGVEDIVQAPYGDSAIPYGTNDADLLERALHNIERHFIAVGLQERFDESLLLFQAKTGWPTVTYQAVNVGGQHYTKVRATPEEVDVIREYNRLDLSLYGVLAERFEQDLQATLPCPALQAHVLRWRNRWAGSLGGRALHRLRHP
jgi:hypothetical protein